MEWLRFSFSASHSSRRPPKRQSGSRIFPPGISLSRKSYCLLVSSRFIGRCWCPNNSTRTVITSGSYCREKLNVLHWSEHKFLFYSFSFDWTLFFSPRAFLSVCLCAHEKQIGWQWWPYLPSTATDPPPLSPVLSLRVFFHWPNIDGGSSLGQSYGRKPDWRSRNIFCAFIVHETIALFFVLTVGFFCFFW